MGKTQSAGNRGEAAVARYLRQKAIRCWKVSGAAGLENWI